MRSRTSKGFFFLNTVLTVLLLVGCSETRGATRGTGIFDARPEAKTSRTTTTESSEEIVFEDEAGFSTEDEVQSRPAVTRKPAAERAPRSAAKGVDSEDERRADYDRRDAVRNASDQSATYDYRGLASWYGREFHGRKTASGGSFDMYALSAAHRELPFGTVLKVTNLDNGKSIRVTINDRGPYKYTRIIDLSYAAARDLGFLAKGEQMVGINVLSYGDNKYQKDGGSVPARTVKPVAGSEEFLVDDGDDYGTPRREPKALRAGGFELQAGAFYSMNNARKMKERVESLTGGVAEIVEEGDLYKVKLVNIGSKAEAERFMRTLETDNIKSILLQK
jgi:rare lipoprotein A